MYTAAPSAPPVLLLYPDRVRTGRGLADGAWRRAAHALRAGRAALAGPVDRLDRVYEGLRLRGLRDRHRGARCFLVGNGPSLRHQDLGALRGELVFSTNKLLLHPQHDRMAPRYYCVSDTLFLDGLAPEMRRLLREKSPALESFFPRSIKPALRRSGLVPARSVYFLTKLGVPIWERGTMRLDPSRGVFTGQNVIIDFCLPLAFYMGFAEVYLLGCDTDYGLDRAEDYSAAYFYDVSVHRPLLDPVHHRTAWYDNVVRSYEVARRMFEAGGRRIYNATAGGKLEVFPRVDLAAVLAGACAHGST